MNDINMKDIFNRFTGVMLFRATMSHCGFEFLTNCLRFDDKDTREKCRATNRLVPVRELFDHIVALCIQNVYTIQT